MPVILNNDAVFLHVPKTGGDWVGVALRNAGLIKDVRFHKHAGYERVLINDPTLFSNNRWRPLPEPLPDSSYMFCFVRHPVSWYVSYWRYTRDMGVPGWGKNRNRLQWHPNAALNNLWCDSFEGFVNNVITHRPGYLSELFAMYAQPDVGVFKQEDLPGSLIDAVVASGITVDDKMREAITQTPVANVTKGPKPEVSRATRLAIEETEKTAMMRYDYV